MTANPPVIDNAPESRFEVSVDGHVAVLEYERDEQHMEIVHTEVPDELEGRGLGGLLVTAAVDDAAQRGVTVVPTCSFARGWLQRHPKVAARAVIDRSVRRSRHVVP